MERLIEKIADAEAAITTPDGGRIECRVRELGEVSSGYDGFGTLRYYKSYLVLRNAEESPTRLGNSRSEAWRWTSHR